MRRVNSPNRLGVHQDTFSADGGYSLRPSLVLGVRKILAPLKPQMRDPGRCGVLDHRLRGIRRYGHDRGFHIGWQVAKAGIAGITVE